MKRYPVLSTMLCVALVLYPVIPAGAISAPAAAAKGLTVKVGAVTGVVTNAMGRPMTALPIQLRDQAGRVVAAMVTDRAGRFMFTQAAAGQFTLNVGKMPPLAIEAKDDGAVSELALVVPEDEGLLFGLTWYEVAGLGLAIATAITLPLALDGGGGGGVLGGGGGVIAAAVSP